MQKYDFSKMITTYNGVFFSVLFLQQICFVNKPPAFGAMCCHVCGGCMNNIHAFFCGMHHAFDA